MKKIFIALLMAVLFQSAQAFDYTSDRIKVKWTDESGVAHENLLTDEATDPRHIIALLQELYCNSEVPGNKNVDGIEDNGCDNGWDPHYGNVHTDPTDYLGRPVERFPDEDRFTCILVELKDGAKELPTTDNVEDFEKCVKRVTLIPSVAESLTLPGQYNKDYQYILSITGSYDNFYFAAKGKPRKGAKCGNWERLSPTQSGKQGTEGFYETVKSGASFKVTHDCDDIVADKHFIEINPGGEAPYMKHLTLVVPKNRFAPWEGRDKDGEMSWYNPDHCPYIGLYLITNTSSSVSRPNQYTPPIVTLKWSTNLRTQDGLNWTGAEKSDLYLINDDGTEKLVNTLWHDNDYNVEFVQQFWDVPEEEVGKYLRFKVVCYTFDERDANGPHATEAESYIEVFVPGKKDEMNVEYNYRSRFEELVSKNSYKNTFRLNICNMQSGNAPRTLHRTNADGSNPVDVATVTFEGGSYKDVWSDELQQMVQYYNYDGTYTVTYNNAMPAGTQYRYDNKPLVINGDAKDGIEICDYFFADTKDGGDHSGGYIYTITGGPSNLNESQFVVPVYAAKVQSTYNTSHYQISQVVDDIHAPWDGDDDSADHSHMDLTNYNEVKLIDYEGNIDDVISFDFYKNHSIAIHGVSSSNSGASTVENILTGEMTTKVDDTFNTYGTNSVAVQLPQVAVDFEQVEASHRGGESSFGVTLAIKPTLASRIAPYVYYYRIWRVEEGEGMETKITTLNNEKDESGATWATTYANVKYQFPCGESEDSNKGVMRVRDIFQRPTDTVNDSRMVSYIVRMYTTTDYQEQDLELAPALTADGDLDEFNPMCMVSQCSNVVTFSNKIVTGVNDVTAQKEVSSVRYVNMLGVTSDRPFDGINIVVTTYTDGTQSTMKVCN